MFGESRQDEVVDWVANRGLRLVDFWHRRPSERLEGPVLCRLDNLLTGFVGGGIGALVDPALDECDLLFAEPRPFRRHRWHVVAAEQGLDKTTGIALALDDDCAGI